MIIAILIWVLFSPLLPMIWLFKMYFTPGSNRIAISLLMLGVCALSVLLGSYYADHTHGLDGLRALGAIWGGAAGFVLSIIILIVSIVRRLIG